MSEIRPHYKDFNIWDTIDEDEIDRLQKTLRPHLKKKGYSYDKKR